MKERLLQLLDIEQLNPSKFADLIGVQRSSVSHVLSGRNNPSFDFLQKTLKAFPGLNAQWLIMGEGGMFEKMVENLTTQPRDPLPGQMGSLFSHEEERVAGSGAHKSIGNRESEEFSPVPDQPETVRRKAREDSADQAEATQAKKDRKLVRVLLFFDDQTFRSYTSQE